MTFTENILPAMLAVPIAGFILREWISLMLLPSIEPERPNIPEPKESRSERPKTPLLPPDLSLVLAKAYKDGATDEELHAAIKTVAAKHRIERLPDVKKPDLEIIQD